MECFKRVKAVIASAPVLEFFDPSVEAVLQCDASQHGLGVCLNLRRMGNQWPMLHVL